MISLGVYDKHLNSEPPDADTVQFVRRLGLCNVVVGNIVVAV